MLLVTSLILAILSLGEARKPPPPWPHPYWDIGGDYCRYYLLPITCVTYYLGPSYPGVSAVRADRTAAAEIDQIELSKLKQNKSIGTFLLIKVREQDTGRQRQPRQ